MLVERVKGWEGGKVRRWEDGKLGSCGKTGRWIVFIPIRGSASFTLVIPNSLAKPGKMKKHSSIEIKFKSTWDVDRFSIH